MVAVLLMVIGGAAGRRCVEDRGNRSSGSQASFSQTCDFSYIAQELPILSLDSVDLTEDLTEEAWNLSEIALPNVKMVFWSGEPNFSSFLGWADLPENYAKLSREQATGRLREAAELAIWNAELEDRIFEYELLDDDPLTLSFIHKYTDGGQYYWDLGADIIATPDCIVSLKISTVVEELTDEELAYLQASLASLRRMVVATPVLNSII